MNPTPERALELADYLEHKLDNDQDALVKFAAMSSKDLKAEIAMTLRAYADLSRKWQSVVDAEPVATVCMPDHEDGREGVRFSLKDWGKLNALPARTQLIIKPTA